MKLIGLASSVLLAASVNGETMDECVMKPETISCLSGHTAGYVVDKIGSGEMEVCGHVAELVVNAIDCVEIECNLTCESNPEDIDKYISKFIGDFLFGGHSEYEYEYEDFEEYNETDPGDGEEFQNSTNSTNNPPPPQNNSTNSSSPSENLNNSSSPSENLNNSSSPSENNSSSPSENLNNSSSPSNSTNTTRRLQMDEIMAMTRDCFDAMVTYGLCTIDSFSPQTENVPMPLLNFFAMIIAAFNF